MLRTEGAVNLGRRPAKIAEPLPTDLLNSATVRRILGGISEMSLWRWSSTRNFPRPDLIIARRKFWRRSTIERWVDSQIAGA